MRILLIILVLVTACASPVEEQTAMAVNDSTASQPAPVQQGLYDRKEIGKVRGLNGRTFIVCSGRYCEECDAEIALYVYDEAAPLMEIENNANARLHPGTVRDGETGEPFYESRAFFGEVLQGVPGVIWYERSLGTNGTMEEHTVLLDLSAGMEDSQQPGHVLLDRTLVLAAEGKCSEITGMDRMAAP